MTELIDIKAFLVTARTGSFSAAGREIGVAPSIVTKRVGRLEHRIGSVLFIRSTRKLTLTPDGERLRPQLQLLAGELDDVLDGVHTGGLGVAGDLRIKAPTTVGALHVGPSVARFHARNPDVRVEMLLVDRVVNPLEEGFDIALGALPASYTNVIDVPLCRYDRVLVGAPDYLARSRPLKHPTDIAQHDCLTFLPVGLVWSFATDRGDVVVDVHSIFSVNDSGVLLAAAEAGCGLAVIPRFIADPALARGTVVELLPETPPKTLWFKALVPRNKAAKPQVRALLEHLKQEFSPVPPWDRGLSSSNSEARAISAESPGAAP